MIKIGLTGGIGTGKSVVAGIFSGMGIPIFFADQEAKKAYSDLEVLQKIKVLFGESIFDNQSVNFIKLSNLIFSNKIELEKLNDIIHPFVLQKFENWITENSSAPYVIMESAILYETGYDTMFDKMIAVTAPTELCIERVMQRDGIDRDMVLKRMSNQFPNETKVDRADFCVQNNSQELIAPQVADIHKSILSL
ncbi:MAG: dephospho-CoA kinase [Bacteroidota bacterium]